MKLIKQKNQGFTLIELLIVVVILGVLAAVAIPQFTSNTADAQDAAIDSTLGTVRTAIDMYFAEHGVYPAANAATGDVTGAVNTQAAFEAQLTKFTDANGDTSFDSDPLHPFGPYMKKKTLANEPITQINTLEIITTGDLEMDANTTPVGGPGGWRYDDVTGEFIVNLITHEDR